MGGIEFITGHMVYNSVYDYTDNKDHTETNCICMTHLPFLIISHFKYFSCFYKFLQIIVFFSWKLYSWCCHSGSFSFLFNLHDAAKNSIQKGSLSFTLHQGEHRPTVHYVLETLWCQHIKLNHCFCFRISWMVKIGPKCKAVTLLYFFYNEKNRNVKKYAFSNVIFLPFNMFSFAIILPRFEKR